MPKKVLVTGGCGFIGSYVVESLVKRKYQVSVIDYVQTWTLPGVEYFKIDIRDRSALEKIINTLRPEVCIHLAGLLGTSETWDYVDQTVSVNIIGANNVYDLCGQIGCHLITVDVGSRWLSPYTISKTCSADFALAFANKHKVKCGLLRIFNVYGPRQSTKIIKVCPIFIYKALANDTLEIWGNKNTDLVHAYDVGEAFARAVSHLDQIDGRRDLYIGSGQQLTTAQFASMIIDRIGSGQLVHQKARLGEENIQSGHMDNDMAFKLLGWKPTIPLKQGLDQTISYYLSMNILEHYGTF
jgi:UDP-glucose 4-epimerase